MCTGGCAKCLGTTLIPLAVLCTLANILLFFPGGKVAENNLHITDEVWYFGGILGSGVLMIFPALVFLGLKNNDCCGCCGNQSCGKRFAMFSSIIFAAVGLLGAGYCFVLSAVAINKGPKCNTGKEWTYPFHDGDYLSNHTLWSTCKTPENIVPWNLTLFSLLLVMSGIQAVLCSIQVVNGLFGTICGDCKCCGCCGLKCGMSHTCKPCLESLLYRNCTACIIKRCRNIHTQYSACPPASSYNLPEAEQQTCNFDTGYNFCSVE